MPSSSFRLFVGSYWEDVFVQAVSFALLAVGLNVVVGLAGLLDMGYVAFWAIGAYTMAILSGAGPGQFAHLNVWEILPLGIAFAMIAGVLLGLPVLRLRGDYLAIVTLGFGEIIRITAAESRHSQRISRDLRHPGPSVLRCRLP